MKKEIEEFHYETPKTHEDHIQKACQPIAEGIYAIVKHKSHHKNVVNAHLLFVIGSPCEIGGIQTDFDIPKEGNFILTIKNPNITDKFQPEPVPIPHHLLSNWKENRWSSLTTGELLSVPKARILIIAAAAEPPKEGDKGADRSIVDELKELEAEVEDLNFQPDQIIEDLKLEKDKIVSESNAVWK